MSATDTEAAIRQFLLAEVFYDRDLQNLRADENLIERGLLDSLGILKTVEFCEAHFGITIPDHEVLPDHMESVRAIAQLVERRRTVPPR
ncbi:MAG TPA: acyl carrier protein [Candidatus Limnocylindria bacterium]|nr:acyl carrier protein [Candidatus Limnocylindria bacterium]